MPSTPAHQTLPCFPPPALGGNHLLLCVLPAWVELSCCLSISLYQLLDGSCRAATALRKQRQMVLDVRSYGRTTAKAISLNSQQNRFHQRQKISEFKRFSRTQKRVHRTDKEAARRHEINLDNSLSPTRRKKTIKRKYCIALKGIVRLYNG